MVMQTVVIPSVVIEAYRSSRDDTEQAASDQLCLERPGEVSCTRGDRFFSSNPLKSCLALRFASANGIWEAMCITSTWNLRAFVHWTFFFPQALTSHIPDGFCQLSGSQSEDYMKQSGRQPGWTCSLSGIQNLVGDLCTQHTAEGWSMMLGCVFHAKNERQ